MPTTTTSLSPDARPARRVLSAAAAIVLLLPAPALAAPTPPLTSPNDPPPTPNVVIFSTPAGRYLVSGGHWSLHDAAAPAPQTFDAFGLAHGLLPGTIAVPTNVTAKGARGSRAGRGKSGRGQQLSPPTVVGADRPILGAAGGE